VKRRSWQLDYQFIYPQANKAQHVPPMVLCKDVMDVSQGTTRKRLGPRRDVVAQSVSTLPDLYETAYKPFRLHRFRSRAPCVDNVLDIDCQQRSYPADRRCFDGTKD
jgi:hypothetical protein